MAFFAPTDFAGALLLPLVLAWVVALPTTCRPFEAPVGLAEDLGLALLLDVGLAADVDAFATLVLA